MLCFNLSSLASDFGLALKRIPLMCELITHQQVCVCIAYFLRSVVHEEMETADLLAYDRKG